MRAADDRGNADPPTRKTLALALAATAAVVCIFLIYRHRPVVVPLEGAESLRAAWSLLDHGALDSTPQTPYADFGVLYPLLLAALARTGLGPLGAIVLINSVVLVVSLLAFAVLARRVTGRSALFAVPLFWGLAVHPYYFRQARLDALVPAAGMLAIFFASEYAERFRRRDLLATAVTCAAATTVRYIGVIPLATLGAFVLWSIARRPGRGRFLDALLFLGVGWGPIAAWLLRNHARTGYLTGMSRTEWRTQAAANSLDTNVVAIAKSFFFDFFGVRVMGVLDVLRGTVSPPHPQLTIWLFALATAAVIAAIVVARQARGHATIAAPHPLLDTTISVRATRLVALWFAAYLAALVALWTWANNDPMQTRYVGPLYGFAVLLAFRAAERLRDGPGSLAPALILAATLAVFLPNVDKAGRLLSDTPGPALMRTRPYVAPDAWIPREKDLWMHSLTWEQVAAGPSAPALPAGPVGARITPDPSAGSDSLPAAR